MKTFDEELEALTTMTAQVLDKIDSDEAVKKFVGRLGGMYGASLIKLAKDGPGKKERVARIIDKFKKATLNILDEREGR